MILAVIAIGGWLFCNCSGKQTQVTEMNDDSLNVSAATTILVYEAVRQRIAAGVAAVPEFVPWHGEGRHDH